MNRVSPRGATRRRASRRETGMVTAETAVVLPVLAAVAMLLVWVVSLGVTQVRLVDASREAARMVARGDDPVEVRTRVEASAPDGASVRIDPAGASTTVRVTVDAHVSLPLFDRLPAVRLTARSVSANEGTAGGDTPRGDV